MDEAEFYRSIGTSLRDVSDVVSRLDERILVVQGRDSRIDKKWDQLQVLIRDLDLRILLVEQQRPELTQFESDLDKQAENIHAIDLRLVTVEGDIARSDSVWSSCFTWVSHLVWVVVAAYALFKLHLDPVP